MFWHIFKYRFKCLIRDRQGVFWTCLYPIVLATLFSLAFSNLHSANLFSRIPIGVIDNAEYQNNAAFQQAVTSASTGEDPLFLVTLTDRNQADESLENGDIKGYIQLDNGPKIFVKESALEQTVIKEFVDSYLQVNAAITTISTVSPDAMQGFHYASVDTNQYLSEANPERDPDSTVIYFYALIAMAALFGSMWGNQEITHSQANMSPQGARLSLSPVNKFRAISYALLASVAIQFLELLVLIAYLTLILGVNFGPNLPLVILVCLAGGMAGVTFGAMISALAGKKEQIKMAVLISSGLFLSYLSGLMAPSVKYAVTQAVPVMRYINPANLITDALYSLYYYSSHGRFFLNIILLFAFSLVCTVVAFLKTRRQKYASI